MGSSFSSLFGVELPRPKPMPVLEQEKQKTAWELDQEKAKEASETASRQLTDAQSALRDSSDPAKNPELNALLNPKVGKLRGVLSVLAGGAMGFMGDPRFQDVQGGASLVSRAIGMPSYNRDKSVYDAKQEALKQGVSIAATQSESAGRAHNTAIQNQQTNAMLKNAESNDITARSTAGYHDNLGRAAVTREQLRNVNEGQSVVNKDGKLVYDGGKKPPTTMHVESFVDTGGKLSHRSFLSDNTTTLTTESGTFPQRFGATGGDSSTDGLNAEKANEIKLDREADQEFGRLRAANGGDSKSALSQMSPRLQGRMYLKLQRYGDYLATSPTITKDGSKSSKGKTTGIADIAQEVASRFTSNQGEGGSVGVKMRDRNGGLRLVPTDDVEEAQKNGYKIDGGR